LHFALALMQLLPHGWPFVHLLQQTCPCCASSTHSDMAVFRPSSAKVSDLLPKQGPPVQR
jgi:hypothetical protein